VTYIIILGILSSNNEVLNNVRLEYDRAPTSSLQNTSSSSIDSNYCFLYCIILYYIRYI